MRVPSLQRVFGKLAISPDEGDLRLGRRSLALGNSGKARFDSAAVDGRGQVQNVGVN